MTEIGEENLRKIWALIDQGGDLHAEQVVELRAGIRRKLTLTIMRKGEGFHGPFEFRVVVNEPRDRFAVAAALLLWGHTRDVL